MYEDYNSTGYGTGSEYTTGAFSGQTANNSSDSGKQPKEKKKGGYFKKLVASVSLGLFFGLFAGIGIYAVQQGAGMLAPTTTEETSGTDVTDELAGSTENVASTAPVTTTNVTYVQSDVTSVVEKVMPAMVSIVNNTTTTTEFFGQTYSKDSASAGSGIIVGETGTELLIATNNHVVADANSLTITFIDGSEATANIKGVDSDKDLAVIAVALDDLSAETKSEITVATLGDSDSLQLGEQVVAIGNAMGYGQSVTVGYVSALNREVTTSNGVTNEFIQTDAAINPGNSGGALLNMNGEVIGINNNKITLTNVEGMCYAIPISAASPILSDLMEKTTKVKLEESEVGYMGVSLQAVSEQISQMYNMPEGVYVISVADGSPAATAGIMTGDIITKFDGNTITTYEELQSVMQYYGAGDTATLVVERVINGSYEEISIDITLGSKPASQQ